MLDITEFRCPFVPKDDIHQQADLTREKLWGNEFKLPVNVELIIEKAGLDIIPMPLPRNIDALLMNDLSIVENTLRAGVPAYQARHRFSLAHEFGHFVLHRSFVEKMAPMTADEYVSFLESLPEDQYSRFEYQASEFGGRLLVPYSPLKSEVDKAVEDLKDNGLLNMVRDNPDQVLASISPQVCKPFFVSQQCIEVRIRYEGLWPPDRYRT